MRAEVLDKIPHRKPARGLSRHHWRDHSRSVAPLKTPKTSFDILARHLTTERINADLSKLLNTSKGVVRAWRDGRRKAPQWAVEHLIKIGRAKHAALGEAIKRAENPE